MSGGRVVFDLTSAARWSGPPVGIVRAQRELAGWAREHLPGVVFALFDPRSMAYCAVLPGRAEAFIAGRASLNAWRLPDATGLRTRRSGRVPGRLYDVLQWRRSLLRVLERVRLAERRPRLAALADWAQRALMTPRHRAPMIDPGGARRDFLTPDMVFGAPIEFRAADILVCAGFGWSHSNIAAIARAKAASGFRLAMLCYDIIPLMRPDLFKPRDIEDMRHFWGIAFGCADLVVVNAHAVAADVRRYCEAQGLACAPIRIRPLGASPATMCADADAALPAGLESDRYALFVSTIEPRKGHEMLRRVWLRLLEAGLPQASGFKLVFVGRPGWMMDELARALKTDPRIAGSLVTLDQVSDAELDLLYRRAAFCLYPSLYEGYGLPLLEAFARGKAVLASDGGALAEVAAGFSPVLPARDEDAWFETFKRWIEDPAARAPFEAAIRERFAHPSWEAASAGFFAAVAEALAEPAAA